MIDPQVQVHLDRMASFNLPPMHAFTPEQMREGMRRLQMSGEVEAVAHVTDRTINTTAGNLTIRLYRPDSPEPMPVILYLHGGGFVVGSLDSHDAVCRRLANAAKSIVVAVDYPLAPEHPFPAAPEACYAVAEWLAAHAAEFGGDPTRLAVGGDSAGGNLTAVVTQQARDRKGPKFAFQFLIYPDTDFRRNSESVKRLAGTDGNLSMDDMAWFMDHYLDDPALKLDPRVSPLLAKNFSNLPPALIITAEYDTLRDEGEAYGRKLKAAGVPVTIHEYPGMIHEFLRQPFRQSDEALTEIATAVKKAFAV